MKRMLVANHKMNLDIDEINDFIDSMDSVVSDDIVICPTSIYLPYFLGKGYFVGVQNIYGEDKGSFTGEVSPKQAKKIGAIYAIVGHSERRLKMGETDEMVNHKIKSCITNEITPIMCIGETIEQKQLHRTNKVIQSQLEKGLHGLTAKDVEKAIIAYEPIWAIGSGEIPTNRDISVIIKYIKNLVSKKFDVDVKVLYGGSVNPSNVEELNKVDVCDGYLVGGASLKVEEFKKLIKEVVN